MRKTRENTVKRTTEKCKEQVRGPVTSPTTVRLPRCCHPQGLLNRNKDPDLVNTVLCKITFWSRSLTIQLVLSVSQSVRQTVLENQLVIQSHILVPEGKRFTMGPTQM